MARLIMPSHYKNIYGYFDFENIYAYAVDRFRQGRFVEVGTWLGKSTCFMAELLKETKFPIKFFGVDTFKGEINAKDQQDIVNAEGGQVYDLFWCNMKTAGVVDYVTPIMMTSVKAAKLFDDESLDFIFLDAEHLYANVLQDLNAWWPKLKKGGLFGGHDYSNRQGEVFKAVNEFMAIQNVPIGESICSFLVQK